MIHLSPEARLNIILPNTNKALSEAIKNATPEQLEQLKEGKDIKSLLTSVFQDKITASKSDQTLLELLKNSTASKTMGNFSDDLKSLLKELKTSPDLVPKTANLESFLKNGATIDGTSLKTQIANSGIFMESKFAAVLQKIPDLTQMLQQLQTLLAKNPLPEAKTMQTQIASLLESPILAQASTNPQSALLLSNSVKQLADTLSTLILKNDVIYSKEVAALVQKFDQPLSPSEVKTTLSQLYGTLLSSNVPDADTLLDGIEKLLKNAASSDELKTFSEELKTVITEGDTAQESTAVLTKLSEFTHPEDLLHETALRASMTEDLKSNLLSLHEELVQSNDPSSQKQLEQIDKLLTQIDYHQLVSYLGTSNSIYFPFAWDQLEEGSMAFKKTTGKKFYCEINLKLKNYGELNLMMALYEGNQLEIQAHTEKPELKTLIHDNIAQLRALLIDADLTPRSIRVFEMRDHSAAHSDGYEAQNNGTDLGFEVKV